MKSPANWFAGAVAGLAGRLRFPYLFLLTATLFLLDIMIPDLLPMADEVLLGLGTLLFATWRKRERRPGERAEPPAP